jgi:hypothetical protein
VISLLLISGVYIISYYVFPMISTWLCVIFSFLLVVMFVKELLGGVLK